MTVLVCLLILWSCFASSVSLSETTTFTNPILDTTNIRSSSITRIGDFYYLLTTTNEEKELQILKSPFLSNFRFAKKRVFYRVPAGYGTVHPNSLFQHDGQLYLYIHMHRREPSTQQLFVMKADDPENPMGTWAAPIRLLDHIWDKSSLSSSVLEMNDKLYLSWSSVGQSGNVSGAIYMAEMTSPTEVFLPVSLLREPHYDWECVGACYNENPVFFQNRETIYALISASSSRSSESCITYMSIQTGQDPLVAANWVAINEPVFVGDPNDNAISPAFPKITTSPDGTETWMLYSASTNTSDIWLYSTLRIEKINFEVATGVPVFPEIHGSSSFQPLPSGEPAVFTNPVLSAQRTYGSIYWDDNYYYLSVNVANGTTRKIEIHKSGKLHDFNDAEIFTVIDGVDAIYEAKLFPYNGEIHAYLTKYTPERTICYTKIGYPSEITQPWKTPVDFLSEVWDREAYHGTVMVHDNILYFVFSENAENNGIYIAKMDNPGKVVGPVVLLKEPTESWECHSGWCIADFPHFIYQNNVTYMVYSSSNAWQEDSVLSYMSLESGKDPLQSSNWFTAEGPVFSKYPVEQVYATSHPWFTNSPDGSEIWMMYNAAQNNDENPLTTLRIEKIEWDLLTGKPLFPKPHGFQHPQPVPSSIEYFSNPAYNFNLSNAGIFQLGSFYYLTLSENGSTELTILKSGKLTNFTNAERRIV